MRENSGQSGTDEGLQETAKRRVRAVIENAPAFIFLLDSEGVVTLSGGKCMASFGMRPGDTVGESALAMDHLPEVVKNVREPSPARRSRRLWRSAGPRSRRGTPPCATARGER